VPKDQVHSDGISRERKLLNREQARGRWRCGGCGGRKSLPRVEFGDELSVSNCHVGGMV